jgi:aerobic carbon-monoxide dehydrogenase medium subunit
VGEKAGRPQDLNDSAFGEGMMHNFKYYHPRTVEEALALLAEYGEDVKLIAGGQSLLLLMREGLIRRAALISLLDIPGMDGINLDQANGAITIGALATHRQVERSPLVAQKLPLLAAAYPNLASIQVRNLGTLGGNLCHNGPGSDPPASLVALDATVVLWGPHGRRSLSVEDFGTSYYETALLPTEILEQVRIPIMPARSAGAYQKLALRRSDLHFVNTAVRITLTEDRAGCKDVRIALGGVAPTTVRARAAEKVLRGQRLSERIIAEAGAVAVGETDPISDSHASAEYRRQVTPIAVQRALREAWQHAGGM